MIYKISDIERRDNNTTRKYTLYFNTDGKEPYNGNVTDMLNKKRQWHVSQIDKIDKMLEVAKDFGYEMLDSPFHNMTVGIIEHMKDII